MVGHQLGGHILIKLTTVNKALLGRQPKPLNFCGLRFFFFLILSLLGLLLLVFNFIAFVLQVSRFRGFHGEGKITRPSLCKIWEE